MFSSLRFRGLVAVGFLTQLVSLTQAGIVPTFSSAVATGTHEAGAGAPAIGHYVDDVVVKSGSASKSGPWNPHSHVFASGSTKAKAGVARTQSSSTAKVTFATGTGVDQTDAGDARDASVLKIDFTATWNIVGGSFGPAIVGSASFPVGAKVAAGGSASFDCAIFWDMKVGGVLFTNVRSPFITAVPFGPGTHLTTVTAPASPFSPPSITDTGAPADNDQFIVHGFIRFTADNEVAPALVELLGPEVNDPADQERTKDWQDLLMDFPELNNPTTDQFKFDSFATFDEVPEPGSLALLAIGIVVPLARRRRA